MMQIGQVFGSGLRFLVLGAALALVSACASPLAKIPTIETVELDPDRQAFALREVQALQAKGHRVWCVPYARNVSGIQIRGDAHTWWYQGTDDYRRGAQPKVGAVMVFSKTRRNTRGHLAVVSEIISDREMRIDHANWKRNRISQNMLVIDVSKAGDWSAIKVESQPGSFGRVYPISGFVYAPTGGQV